MVLLLRSAVTVPTLSVSGSRSSLGLKVLTGSHGLRMVTGLEGGCVHHLPNTRPGRQWVPEASLFCPPGWRSLSPVSQPAASRAHPHVTDWPVHFPIQLMVSTVLF